MKKPFSRKQIGFLGLAALLLILFYLWIAWGSYGPGFPLDDAWIHQTYARNIATEGEWSFVPGQPSAGLTAPIWAILLMPGYWLGLAPYYWVMFISWLTLWGLGIVGGWAFFVVTQKEGYWPFAAGLILMGEWHMVWAAVSGMETLLFSLLILYIFGRMFRVMHSLDHEKLKDWFILGALVGLSVWLRPEGLTLLGPLGMSILCLSVSWKNKINRWILVAGGVAVLFLPYLLFNYWLAGTWWPNTFYAKQAEYAVLLEQPFFIRLFAQLSLPLIGIGLSLLPGYIYIVGQSIKKKDWVLIWAGVWAIGFLILYAMRLPVTYQHGRYAMPIMPAFILMGFIGFSMLITRNSESAFNRIFTRVWLLVTPIIAFGFFLLGAQSYAKDVGVINTEMVATAQWISQNTAEDALIAAHDIGALGFFGEREIIDLAGLVSPEVIPFIRDESQLTEFLDQLEPNYFMTFPDWYQELGVGKRIVFQTEGEVVLTFDRENMVVYQWTENE